MRTVLLICVALGLGGCVTATADLTARERGMLNAAYNNCPPGVACERGGRTASHVAVPGNDVFVAETWSSHGSRAPIIVVPTTTRRGRIPSYYHPRYAGPYNGWGNGCYGRTRLEHGEWVWRCW